MNGTRISWRFRSNNRLLHIWEHMVEVWDLAAYALKLAFVILAGLLGLIFTGRIFRKLAIKFRQEF